MANRIYIDIESYSAIDLAKLGVYRYAEDKTTEILCMAWAINQSPPELWTQGNPLPAKLINELTDPRNKIVAHNAQFERVMLSGPPGQAINFPKIPINIWVCTAVKAAANGLPRNLEGAAAVLDLSEQKDQQGAWVMRKLCTPHKPTKKEPWSRYTTENSPDLFEQLYKYCLQDIATTQALDLATLDITKIEQQYYAIDQIINDLGVAVDLETVNTILNLSARYIEYLENKTKEITGGLVSSQRDAILEWLRADGTPIEDYRAASVQAALDRSDISPQSRIILKTRQAAGKTSVAKYQALKRSASIRDNKIRGMFMFHGAGTGRWTSKLVQLHNLPRGKIKNTDTAINAIKTNDLAWLVTLYDNPMDLFSGCVRPMLVPDSPDKEFIIGDFSGIEAVCLGWAAQEPKYIHAHKNNISLYKAMAADVYNKEINLITQDERQVGKMIILGLGYQMGVGTFIAEATKARLPASYELLEHAHRVYREKYKRIVKFWYAMESAAKAAVSTGKVQKISTCEIYFGTYKKWLFMKLPSGRKIAYFMPELRMVDTPWGSRRQLTFIGQDSQTKQYIRQSTYGGMLTENAIQGIARDILANAMFNIYNKKIDILLHVHDELVNQIFKGAYRPDDIKAMMETPPAWADGCYIRAEVFRSDRYVKG